MDYTFSVADEGFLENVLSGRRWFLNAEVRGLVGKLYNAYVCLRQAQEKHDFQIKRAKLQANSSRASAEDWMTKAFEQETRAGKLQKRLSELEEVLGTLQAEHDDLRDRHGGLMVAYSDLGHETDHLRSLAEARLKEVSAAGSALRKVFAAVRPLFKEKKCSNTSSPAGSSCSAAPTTSGEGSTPPPPSER